MTRTVLWHAIVATLFVHSARSEPLPSWEAHLGGGVGAARAAMLGTDHGAVAISIDLEAIHWSPSQTGFGLYLGEIVAAPWHTVEMDGHPVIRELPWIIEPEIAHRWIFGRPRHWFTMGLSASLGAGAVITRTSENWSHLDSRHAYEKTLESGVAAGSTVQVTTFARVGPVVVAIGPRLSADTAGDVAGNLEATAGGVW